MKFEVFTIVNRSIFTNDSTDTLSEYEELISMGKEKDPKNQSAYYDYEGENETSQLITDAYSSGVVEQQYEQNFLQENLQPREEETE
ncbi:hypothetical protein AB1K32_00165 [Metabacillus dongyingensis]|uniref:hypothetical protein n=1 Tax=Metabacillus dongyingensis TaxID=2874282 RepID=UPI003B8C5051